MTQTQLDVAAVLFDMDGTLVDSTPVVERLWAQFAAELIKALPDDRLAVVTSAPRQPAEVRLLAAGIGIPKVLVTSEDVTRGKPDPMGYQIAAQRLGVVPQRCLVVEDAEAGLQAGVASGALTVVIGEHESAITMALPRVKDFTDVTVQIFDDFLRITLP